ncbi:hypothetical protein [Roseovarius sp.]
MRIIAILALMGTPAIAEYSDHQTVQLFSNAPCTEAVGLLDAPLMDGTPEMVANQAVEKGMAWGFILGFDAAHGGLSDETDTTLVKLRKACAASRETPAFDLLQTLTE